jgi:hypothetical protein
MAFADQNEWVRYYIELLINQLRAHMGTHISSLACDVLRNRLLLCVSHLGRIEGWHTKLNQTDRVEGVEREARTGTSALLPMIPFAAATFSLSAIWGEKCQSMRIKEAEGWAQNW